MLISVCRCSMMICKLSMRLVSSISSLLMVGRNSSDNAEQRVLPEREEIVSRGAYRLGGAAPELI
jgi:hypothetical protein